MKTIYIVTAGDYSAYHIVGVCSTIEKAKELCKLYNNNCHYPLDGEANIEEYNIDKDFLDTRSYFYVCLDKKTENVFCDDPISPFESNRSVLYSTLCEYKRLLNNVIYYNGNQSDVYTVVVRAYDEDHAKKIACDMIAEFRAHENGISN